jgi:hypothetical protein
MLNLITIHPWLVVVFMALLIPIVGIIFGTITHYLTVVRQAELEANLKHEMLQRGMSAVEIQMVIEATTQRKGKKCMPRADVRQHVS